MTAFDIKVVASVSDSPHEMEQKYLWFSRFRLFRLVGVKILEQKSYLFLRCRSRMGINGRAHWHTSVNGCISWYFSGNPPRFFQDLFGSPTLFMRLLHPGITSSSNLLRSVLDGQNFSFISSRFETSCWPLCWQDPLKIWNPWQHLHLITLNFTLQENCWQFFSKILTVFILSSLDAQLYPLG